MNSLESGEGTSHQRGNGGQNNQEGSLSGQNSQERGHGGQQMFSHGDQNQQHNPYDRLTKLEFPKFNGEDVKG